MPVGIGRANHQFLLEEAVHVNAVVHGLAHRTVGNGEVGIVGSAGEELVVQVAVGAHGLGRTSVGLLLAGKETIDHHIAKLFRVRLHHHLHFCRCLKALRLHTDVGHPCVEPR